MALERMILLICLAAAACVVAPVVGLRAQDGMTLDVCPNDYQGFPMDGGALTCTCSAEQAKADASIFGANPYFKTSDICRAAVNAGAIGLTGGQVVANPAPGVRVFPSVTRNGVRSGSWSADDGFAIANANLAAAVEMAAGNGMSLDVCPNDYQGFPMDFGALSCTCSAEQAKADESIFGANPYFKTSDICRAAVNAGAIGLAGGQVTVTAAPDAKVFPSVTRNGVRSGSWSAGDGFSVKVPQKAETPKVDSAGAPVQAPIAETLRATGQVQLYVNFATDKAEPLPSSAPVLGELLATMRDDPALKLELIGHTDSHGGADYNLDLSERRAASIYLFLVQSGIQPDRLRASGHGLREPIADNASTEGRALNRRVEARQM